MPKSTPRKTPATDRKVRMGRRLGRLPTQIIGSLSERLEFLAARRCASDWIEVRVDSLAARGVTIDEIASALARRRHRTLLTIRARNEGGHMPWRDRERQQLFLRLLPVVDAVDIELGHVRTLKAVLLSAQKLNKQIVLSTHSLERPLTPRQLHQLERRFKRFPVQAYKIASRVNNLTQDLLPLMALLVASPPTPWAVMGVGPEALFSRKILTSLGSRLVYGYLDAPAAPQQPAASALRKMLRGRQSG